MKDSCFISTKNKETAINNLTNDLISYATKHQQLHHIQQQQEVLEAEPAAKRRRTVFEFIKEQQIHSESIHMATAKTELDVYLKEKVIDTNDVFDWWDKNKLRFPNIFPFIKKYLVIPATSVPSERVFSKAGEIISAKRTRISRKHANELVFLNVNRNL